MEHFEYCLKRSDINEIFKKIIENCRGFLEVFQFYKLANDYAPFIISNPNLTPELLFEEELTDFANKKSNNYVIYGNLNYSERSITHLMIFINKILIARLYCVECLEKPEAKLKLQFKNIQFDENLDKIYRKVLNLIIDIVKDKALFERETI